MSFQTSLHRAVFVLGLASSVAAPAWATSYNFAVDYSGGGVAALVSGSDDLLSTSLVAGDNFSYTLSAVGSGYWSTTVAASQFPFIALSVSESGERISDFTIDLLNNGANVFSYSEVGAHNQSVHLGANAVAVPNGLVFDQFVLTDTISSATVASTPNSLLPWPGVAPESAFNFAGITFTSAVPEPETYAMLLAGLGVLGFIGKRRRAG